MNKPIYLDNHATTPVDPRVLEAMLPYFTEKFGNAASRNHAYGWQAEEAVDRARQQVATLLRATPREIVFTSGATEANNLAIKGCLEQSAPGRTHVIVSAIEHKAVLDPCRVWARAGKIRLTEVGVDHDGLVHPGDIAAAITPETALVSVMHANNEIGTIQPLAEIARLAHQAGALFHTDAAQTAGKLAVDVDALGVDLLSLSAHKLYGPKGCGALFVRSRDRRVRLSAQMHGGGHERGMRSGTLNVPGIVGLGAACEITAAEMPSEAARLLDLRERLRARIMQSLAGVELNGHPELRLPGNLNLCFRWVDGESLMMGLRDIAVSSGSACTSITLEPSHVMLAIGRDPEAAHASLRFGIGRFNTAEEIDYVAGEVISEVNRLRELSGGRARAT